MTTASGMTMIAVTMLRANFVTPVGTSLPA